MNIKPSKVLINKVSGFVSKDNIKVLRNPVFDIFFVLKRVKLFLYSVLSKTWPISGKFYLFSFVNILTIIDY